MSVRELLARHTLGLTVAVHIWRSVDFVRGDHNNWFRERFGAGPDQIEPTVFVDALIRTALEYRARLDVVAPIVTTERRVATVEQLLEFTELPFWKHRWFLYELWTLVRVLRTAGTVGVLTLEGVAETRPGILEWMLPGGTARGPVASVRRDGRGAKVWTQLKSQHPATGAGLEPDLRITSDTPSANDLFLVENKDRRAIGLGDLAEIVERYVTGTTARAAWFINYENFPASVAGLEARYSDRGVRVVSRFRPGSVPADFERQLAGILSEHLQPPVRIGPIRVQLTWTSPPSDLDLHAWIDVGAIRHHISFQNQGRLDAEPFAALDVDHRTGGTEIISVARSDYDRITFAVHNYSNDVRLSTGRPLVTIHVGTAQVCESRPTAGAGQWWIIGDVGASGRYRSVDEVGDAPPFA